MMRLILSLGLLTMGNAFANSVYKELRSFDCSFNGQGTDRLSNISLRDIKDIDTGKFKGVFSLTSKDGGIEVYETPEMDRDPQFGRDSEPEDFFGLGGLTVFLNVSNPQKILLSITPEEQIGEDIRSYDFVTGYKESEEKEMGGSLICTLITK